MGNNVTSGTFTVPQYVSGGYTWSQITAGFASSCGITTAGKSFCWGQGGSGQLGTGNTNNSAVPSPISGNYTFTSIAAGADHACAISNAGVTYCWGQCGCVDHETLNDNGHADQSEVFPGQPAGGNANGQLGNNSNSTSTVPVAVLGSDALNFTQVQAAQYFSCGLQANGNAWCWGFNTYGSLGTGDTTPSLVPMMVTGGFAFTQISATHASYTPCAVKATGDAYCW